MNNLELAKKTLNENEYTCVIANESEVIYTSTSRGVKPLIVFFESKLYENQSTLYLADRIIGKAALLICKLVGIKTIHTLVASKEALDYAIKNDINLEYEKLVPRIKNRTNDGYCPMETMALEIEEPTKMYESVINFYNSQR